MVESEGRTISILKFQNKISCIFCLVLTLVLILGLALGLGLKGSQQANEKASTDFNFEATVEDRVYKYLSYEKVVKRLESLQDSFPTLIQVFNTQDLYSLPTAGNCLLDGKSQPCKVYFAVLGNQVLRTNETAEVFLSGCVHGDERIGTTAVVEFATALLEMYAFSPWARQLVDTRTIVIVPAANSVGYDRNTRLENDVDPNRDFAWDQDSASCMKSVAARSINEIYRHHAFQLGFTFHAGDHLIGFTWGDYLHCREIAAGACDAAAAISPDHTAMAALAAALRDFAGPLGAPGLYTTGTMNQVIYPVRGGMEDWAYAASWNPSGRVACAAAAGYSPARTAAYADGTHRAVNLLVETSLDKAPDESTLGAAGPGLLSAGGGDGNGHVARTVRLCWLLAELVRPYVLVLRREALPAEAPAGGDGVALVWRVGGALRLDAALVECVAGDGGAPPPPCVWRAPAPAPADLWPGGRPAKDVQSAVVLPAAAVGRVLSVRVLVRVDQGWAAADRPEAALGPPQTHLARARSDAGWRSGAGTGEGSAAVAGTAWFASQPFTVRVRAAEPRAALATAPTASRAAAARPPGESAAPKWLLSSGGAALDPKP